MINKVTLIGRLGGDPEIRRLDSGVTVAKLNMATTEKYKNNNGELVENTEWHNIVAWRGLADNAEKYFKKGMLMYCEGKLTHRKYTNQEGQDRYITEIVARDMWILSRPGEGRSGGNFPSEQDAPPVSGGKKNMPPVAEVAANENDDQTENDLPF